MNAHNILSNGKSKEFIICDDELDFLAWQAAGHSQVFMLDDKLTNLSEEHSNFLASRDRLFVNIRKRSVGMEFIRRFGRSRLYKINTAITISDLLKDNKTDEIANALVNAKGFPLEGIVTVDDLKTELKSTHKSGFCHPFVTGIKPLDRLWKPALGHVTVITGVPSHGKSSFVKQLSVNLAALHDWHFASFSPEDTPIVRGVWDVLQIYMGKEREKISEAERDKAAAWADSHFAWITTDAETTLNAILNYARQLIIRHGTKGVIIDPWNQVEHRKPRGANDVDYLGECLRLVTDFAKEHQVHVFIVAHPVKMERTKNGKIKPPTLYDINGGAMWYNKVDNGLTVWRDVTGAERLLVKIFIGKVRFRECGRAGDHVELIFKPSGEMVAADTTATPIVENSF